MTAPGSSPVSHNEPALWAAHVPRRTADSHKYLNGPVLVVSGSALQTGAARLAATAALNAGSGAVTLCGDRDALLVHAAHVTAIMLREAPSTADFAALLASGRYRAVVLGPAAGLGPTTLARIEALRASSVPAVLDADALTVLAERLDLLNGGKLQTDCVLTPHQGEFHRLFPDLTARDTRFAALSPAGQASKPEQALAAARITGSVIVFKGHDTVIASPDGRAAINTNAGPELGTAGSGDVLAGIIAAHLAQGMGGFEAAASAVWLHAEAGARFGIGLTADRLVSELRPLAAFLPPG
jgi:hydroxyethylthiazole kinase-like uncharacterized protein yjeF